MEKYLVLFNSLSDNKTGEVNAKLIEKELPDSEFEYFDVIQIENLKEFLEEKGKESNFVLAGGDGTLNHFVNSVNEEDIPEKFFYFPTGTGNDFFKDIFEREGKNVVDVKKYLKNLPICKVNGKELKFFNGIGYGIDGYCCEVADQLKLKSDKPINYAGIAVKGLLFHFKPRDAKITIDGVEHTFKKVWLAPVMIGKYYGGGMIPTPSQDRMNPDGTLSILVWSGSGKLPTLINFSKIFKGAHIAKKKMCTVLTGKHIVVEYAKPCAAQVDGETELNVSKIECFAK